MNRFLLLFVFTAPFLLAYAQNILTFTDLPPNTSLPPCYNDLGFYDFTVQTLANSYGTYYQLGQQGQMLATPSLSNMTLDGKGTQQPTTPTISACGSSNSFSVDSLLFACSARSRPTAGYSLCNATFSCYQENGHVDSEICSNTYPWESDTELIPWSTCTFGNMMGCVALEIDLDPKSLYPTDLSGDIAPQQIFITNITIPA